MPNEEIIRLRLAQDAAYAALPERFRTNPMLWLDHDAKLSVTEDEAEALLAYTEAVDNLTAAQLREMGFQQATPEEAKETLERIIEDNSREQADELELRIQQMTDNLVDSLRNFKVELRVRPFDEDAIRQIVRDTFDIPAKPRRRFRWFRRG